MTQANGPSFAELEMKGWSDPGTAKAYADDFAKAAVQVVPTMVNQARVGPGARALDLCCGHGIVAKGLVQAGAGVTGLDFSPAMLELARAKVPEAELIEGDAMNLTFDAGSFDAVTIGFGIPHVPDPEQVFAQARRVLRKGGRLIYSVWADEDGGLGYVFGAIAQHGAEGIALPPGPGAHDYADPDRAHAALSQAGFGDVTLSRVDSRWQVFDPAAPFEYFDKGTVRGGALLRGQPDQNRAAIRQAVTDKVLSHHGEGPLWDIPIPSVVVAATAV